MVDKKKTKRAELEARARAVIEDERAYDYDTRLAVARALKGVGLRDRDAALAEAVTRAEKGEPPAHPIPDEDEFTLAARDALRVMDAEGLPTFMLDAMMEAIGSAARAFKIEVWKEFPEDLAPFEDYDGQGYSALALARLFRAASAAAFKLQLVTKPTLADHIAAVLNHPDTPSNIYNALGEGVTDLTHNAAVQDSATVIALALEVHARQSNAEEGGAR